MFSETFSCVSSPVQFAAIKAYEYNIDLQQYVADSSSILKGVSQFIYNEFSAINIQCTKPEGAFYMTIGFNNFKAQIAKLGITTNFELANYVLENYQFAMLPGIDFGFTKEDFFFRIAFVDFDGDEVLKAYQENNKIDLEFIKNYTPNVFDGVEKIKSFIKDLKKVETI